MLFAVSSNDIQVWDMHQQKIIKFSFSGGFKHKLTPEDHGHSRRVPKRLMKKVVYDLDADRSGTEEEFLSIDGMGHLAQRFADALHSCLSMSVCFSSFYICI